MCNKHQGTRTAPHKPNLILPVAPVDHASVRHVSLELLFFHSGYQASFAGSFAEKNVTSDTAEYKVTTHQLQRAVPLNALPWSSVSSRKGYRRAVDGTLLHWQLRAR
jgi:hypothetical protein